ncbi:DUF5996 family protein [Streptomyces polyrhachis]|uniref:DUF5996 family protein n=1 Tax=Streptomyces polyrhachis TaxID=1282885 RepID=A0ABW2GKZ7_9ACTN
MSKHRDVWPALVYDTLAPMIQYVNRLVQIGSKYTLDEPFEPGWGAIVLEVTPRGLRTPVYRLDGHTFTVHYRLLDNDVVIESDNGSRTLPLRTGTVAVFYADFVAAVEELGIDPPKSSLICEIPGSVPRFEDDKLQRSWDPEAARTMWEGYDLVAGALEQWQAPFLGHRPPVGVMWGGFDLSATRHRPVPTTPVAGRPAFLQNGELYEYVSVGFSLGDAAHKGAYLYAYIWPQPDGLEGREWGVAGANWIEKEGLVVLPWNALRATDDPHAAVVDFGNAVYEAAVATAGWPANLIGPVCDGWHMSTTHPTGHPR